MLRNWLYALLLSLGGVAGWGVARAQTPDQGLAMGFKSRTYNFRIVVEDLEDSYTVTESGDIRLLAGAPVRKLADEEIRVAVSKATGGLGRLIIQRGGRTFQMLVRPDNGGGDQTRITGLPFGYQVLPAAGRATVGESWTQAFPAPGGAAALRASAAYRYMYKGKKPADGCPDCVEITLTGLRRFDANAALKRSLEAIRLVQPTDFYTADQPFALGTALFSPKQGFLHRFELSGNASLFTVLPVPGMMRRLTLERVNSR